METVLDIMESAFIECSEKHLSEELQTLDGLAMKNVFIFNFVDGYDEKLEMLRSTFEHSNLNNCVEIFDNPTYEELKREVDRIRTINFTLFKYIAVIILDNKSEHKNYIVTKDNVRVLVQTEIVSLLKTNKSLHNMPRLFVIQKLEDFEDESSEDDVDDENGNRTTEIRKRVDWVFSKPEYSGLITLYPGLEFSFYANEHDPNFSRSPFIKVFCQQMLENATKVPMKNIHTNVLRIVKQDLNYTNIDIAFGSNQKISDKGILGEGLDSLEKRDFLD